jgi:nicotinamidase-related amidase
LKQILNDQKVDQLFIVGVATEKAVLYTALDAALLLNDASVYVIEDCCRGFSSALVSEAFRKVGCNVMWHRVVLCDGCVCVVSLVCAGFWCLCRTA